MVRDQIIVSLRDANRKITNASRCKLREGSHCCQAKQSIAATAEDTQVLLTMFTFTRNMLMFYHRKPDAMLFNSLLISCYSMYCSE